MTREVLVYVQQGCADCHQAKEFLTRKGIPYRTRDVVEDEGAMEELERLGSKTLATLVIDNEVYVGFFRNLVRIREVLDIK